jgi:hypothetical protein
MNDQSPQGIAQWLLVKLGKHKKSGSSYQFRCPAHDDKAASGSLKVYQDGVGLKCFTGCTTDEICGALGIQKSELFAAGVGVRSSNILRTYKYFDDHGGLTCVHHRMIQRSKSDAKFLWQRFDEEGNAIWSLDHGWFERRGQNWRRIRKDAKGKDVNHDDSQTSPKPGARWFAAAPPRSLYHQSRLKDAEPGALVIWNEGEKDCHTAEDWGLLSATAGSAQGWQERYADVLMGFDLVIIADNDKAGRIHAAKVATDCYGKAARVRVIEGLPDVPEKGDLSDWAAMGKIRADLLALVEVTPDYKPTGQAVEDEATAVQVELDVERLSEDPKIERYLRQIARNAAKVNDAVDLIARKLGFQGNHSRLLVKLGSIAPDKLGTISCCHSWLAAKYGKSVSTVERDIRKLTDEQDALGIELITYTAGTYNPQAGIGYASKFQRSYLRWALQAIGLAIETRGDLEYGHDALNRACDEVVRGIERKPVDGSAKVNSDDRAEKRASTPDGEALKVRHQIKATVAMKRLLQSMVADGLTLDEAELILSDSFNDSTGWARARAETVEATSAPPDCDQPETKDADYIETVEASESLSLNTNTDSQHDGSAGAGSSFAYGLQNDDHRRIDADPEEVPENQASAVFPMAAEDYYQQDLNGGCAGPQAALSLDAARVVDFEAFKSHRSPPSNEATCDGCGCPLEIGASTCRGCGSLYTASYWRANYGPEVS